MCEGGFVVRIVVGGVSEAWRLKESGRRVKGEVKSVTWS